jgi:hypothetical protein
MHNLHCTETKHAFWHIMHKVMTPSSLGTTNLQQGAGQREAQAMMRDPSMPTMGITGVLANIAICDGGHAEGTLGQASKLKALVRQLTPKKTLAAISEGAVFGGGRLFLGDGSHQESLKVIAKTELHVFALPAEQALLLDHGTLAQELRNHLAFRLTYWFSRTNMIDGQVCA